MSVSVPNPLVLSPHNGGITSEQLTEVLQGVVGFGTHLDASNRQRVSQPVGVFDSGQEYNLGALLWDHVTAGTGAATYTQALSSTVLSTGGAGAAARGMRQTKVYWRYQLGKSHLIKQTGVLAYAGTPTGAAVARIGLFDDRNGVFFGRDATDYFVARRSDTSGAVVETKVYRSAWDDKMDGTGPSGIVADFTKTELFTFDFLWLGSGPVRFGMFIGGYLVPVHVMQAANVLVGPYMRTAHLPLRWEAFNDGGAGSNISVLATCGAIESEGGYAETAGLNFRADTAGATVSCANSATLTPIITLRLKDTFAGLTYRGHVIPQGLEFLNTSTNPAYYQLIWNAATLTGATFANSADAAHSGVEYDLAATAYTGGIVIASGYLGASGVGSNANAVGASEAPGKLLLARTYANVRDTLTIAARGVGGAATLACGLDFRELN